MSAAMELSLGSMPVATGRSTVPTPFDAAGADDLSARWEAAFESASDWRELSAIQQVGGLPVMPDARVSGVSSTNQEPSADPMQPLRVMPSAPAESINVFVHAATVAIVVRNVLLSPEQARQCAFAVAGELAGQRDALHRLTLNGRTIYERHDAPDMRDRTPDTWRLTI